MLFSCVRFKRLKCKKERSYPFIPLHLISNSRKRKRIFITYIHIYIYKSVAIEEELKNINFEFRNRYDSLLWAAMSFPSDTCRAPCANRLIDKIGLSLGERKIRADRA